jgi:outer membrane protein assembly factor BamB
VAYDLASGDEKWKWSGESPGYASPALMNVSGTKLIIAETDRRLVALTAGDGKLVWETPYAVQGRGYNASTPVVEGQTVIFAGSNRGARAVKIEKEGDKFTGKELWSNPEKSVQFNTPVLKNGHVYGLTANNEFFCLNAQDGKTLWSAPDLQHPKEARAEAQGDRHGPAQQDLSRRESATGAPARRPGGQVDLAVAAWAAEVWAEPDMAQSWMPGSVSDCIDTEFATHRF